MKGNPQQIVVLNGRRFGCQTAHGGWCDRVYQIEITAASPALAKVLASAFYERAAIELRIGEPGSAMRCYVVEFENVGDGLSTLEEPTRYRQNFVLVEDIPAPSPPAQPTSPGPRR